MDPLSVAGSVFSGVTLAIQVVRGASVFFVILSPSFREKQKLVKDHGWLTACFLLLGSGKAFAVMRRVERYVLNTGKSDVLFFKESFSSSTNMIAVAAAIVAQVGITALSLPMLDQTHWTAQAFFIASVVLGSLSVYFSCLTQQTFSGFHDADEIKNWLSKSTTGDKDRCRSELERTIPPLDLLVQQDAEGAAHEHRRQKLESVLSAYRWKTASPNAALMLVAPAQLLTLALNAFIIGLGIYLGFVWTSKLIDFPGTDGALAVLIIYIVITLYGLALFYIPSALKDLEAGSLTWFKDVTHELWCVQREDVAQSMMPGAQLPHTPSSHGPPMDQSRRPVDEYFDLEQASQGGRSPAAVPLVQLPHPLPTPATSTSAAADPSTLPITEKSRPLAAITDNFVHNLEALVKAQTQATRASQALLEECRRMTVIP